MSNYRVTAKPGDEVVVLDVVTDTPEWARQLFLTLYPDISESHVYVKGAPEDDFVPHTTYRGQLHAVRVRVSLQEMLCTTRTKILELEQLARGYSSALYPFMTPKSHLSRFTTEPEALMLLEDLYDKHKALQGRIYPLEDYLGRVP